MVYCCIIYFIILKCSYVCQTTLDVRRIVFSFVCAVVGVRGLFVKM